MRGFLAALFVCLPSLGSLISALAGFVSLITSAGPGSPNTIVTWIASSSAGGRSDGLVCRGQGRQETDEFEIGGAGFHGLQRGDQASWRGTAGAEVDTAAGLDRRQSLRLVEKFRTEGRNT